LPLPDAVAARAKSGFGVPLGDWLYPEGAASLAKGAVSRRWAHDLWRNHNLALAA
jgi:hypothetical protein